MYSYELETQMLFIIKKTHLITVKSIINYEMKLMKIYSFCPFSTVSFIDLDNPH